MGKKALREDFLYKRSLLPSEVVREKSILICENIGKWVQDSSFERCFGYMATRNEPSPSSFYEKWAHKLTFALCRVKGKSQMEFRRYRPFEPLLKSKMGILEPFGDRDHEVLEPCAASFVLVPCVAASKSGVRLGYGGGYYDRYFSGGSKAILVGVCFEDFLVDALQAEDHDVKCDFVVTETRVVSVKEEV